MAQNIFQLRSPGIGPNPVKDFHTILGQHQEMLIRRIRDGEQELFYELVRPYERRIYSTALAILRNEADAEDVVVAQDHVIGAADGDFGPAVLAVQRRTV